MKSKIVRAFSVLTPAAILLISASNPGLASAWGQVETRLSSPADPKEFEAFLDAYLASKMEAHHIPGVVFTMVKDGEVFFSKGYGNADLEGQAPINPDQTVLTAASLAKAFTAVGALQLVERGFIDMDEDVRPYFTKIRLRTNFDKPLTPANLLTHTDGFETRLIGGAGRTKDDLLPLEELLRTYMPNQIYPPGRYMTYGDFAANLLGYLIQEKSKIPFEKYMEENILHPLGMMSSTFDQPLATEMQAKLAPGYEFQDGRNEPVPFFYVRYAPSGGLRTTAADMSHFLLALLNGGEHDGVRILDESTTRLMFNRRFAPHPKTSGISCGLFEHLENGRQLFLRDGDGVGTRSRMVLFPEENLGFFISYNSGDSNLRLDIVSAFLDRYYPADGSTGPTPMDDHKNRTRRLAGTYRPLQADVTSFAKSMYFFEQLIEIKTTDEGYLSIATNSMGDEKSSAFGGFEGTSLWVEVEPLYFERVDGKGQLAFVQDESGKVTQMISGQGYHSTFLRLPWHETQTFQRVLIVLVAFLIISMVIFSLVVWPLGGLIRKLRKPSKQRPVSWAEVTARLWLTLVGGMLALFLLRTFGALYGGELPHFVWGISKNMVDSLNSLYLPALLALPLPILVVLAWSKHWWRLSSRVHYTLVTLAVFAGIWWAHYWNLLGFRM